MLLHCQQPLHITTLSFPYFTWNYPCRASVSVLLFEFCFSDGFVGGGGVRRMGQRLLIDGRSTWEWFGLARSQTLSFFLSYSTILYFSLSFSPALSSRSELLASLDWDYFVSYLLFFGVRRSPPYRFCFSLFLFLSLPFFFPSSF